MQTDKYIDKSDNKSWHVLSFDTLRVSWLIYDWSVWNM